MDSLLVIVLSVFVAVFLQFSHYVAVAMSVTLVVLLFFILCQWYCRKKREDLPLGIQEVGFEPPLSQPVMETENHQNVHNRHCDKSTQTHPAWHNGLCEFDDVQKIAAGGFGQVMKGKQKLDQKYYAIKIVPQQKKSNNGLLKEVKTLADFQHKNIVRYHTTWLEEEAEISCSSSDKGAKKVKALLDVENDNIGSFHTAKEDRRTENNVPISDRMKHGCNASKPFRTLPCLYIQMELCAMCLRGWIRRRNADPTPNVNEDQSLRIFRQIIDGLDYIHSKNYIHRDLKPENIFLTEDLTVKIGDFGLLTVQGRKVKRAGTLGYMAPEQKKCCYGFQVDIFALGLILFELLWKFAPGKDGKKWKDIRAGDLPTKFEIDFPVESREIKKMLSQDPEMRPSAADLKKVFFDGIRKEEFSSNPIRKRNKSI